MADARNKLRKSTQILVTEKNWEGCGGLTMTEEIQVTIAGQISLFVLGLDNQYFEAVKSILVYPTAYIANEKSVDRAGVVTQGESIRQGEAWYGGPVVLSWDDVLNDGRYARGTNLVIHEFAHQLDMQNGRNADGVPPLDDPDAATRWIRTLNREIRDLVTACQQGWSTVIDCYGTTNESEFFAVVCEAFFEMPSELKRFHSDLYRLLRDYLRIDPAVIFA